MLARQSPAAAVRHPGATVFDAAYDLYALDGTDYDHATGRYFLSPGTAPTCAACTGSTSSTRA